MKKQKYAIIDLATSNKIENFLREDGGMSVLYENAIRFKTEQGAKDYILSNGLEDVKVVDITK